MTRSRVTHATRTTMLALFVILALLAIAVAAPIWGVDSRDGIDSPE